VPTLKNSSGDTFDVTDVDAVKMQQADPSLQVVGNITTTGEGDRPVAMPGGDVVSQEGDAPATAAEQKLQSRKDYLAPKTSTLGSAARGLVEGIAPIPGIETIFNP